MKGGSPPATSAPPGGDAKETLEEGGGAPAGETRQACRSLPNHGAMTWVMAGRMLCAPALDAVISLQLQMPPSLSHIRMEAITLQAKGQ